MKKNNKTFLIVLFCFAGVLLLGGGITAFIVNYNLQAAPIVEIVDDGGHVYAKTLVNNDYKGYRFKVSQAGNSIYIDSKINYVDLTSQERIIPGEKYSVSVCYLGEIEGNNSAYSDQVDWQAYKYLETPVLTYERNENRLLWSDEDNASYYILYYGANSTKVLGKEVSLGQLVGGENDIFVVAYSNNPYVKASAQSNKVHVQIKHEIQPFISGSFNKESNIISILGREKVQMINVYINGKSYLASKFLCQKVAEEVYQISLDISLINFAGEINQLGVSPAGHDNFNIYTGKILYINEQV